MKKKNTSVYLDLPHFRWPWSAITSILHRVSGILLYLMIAPLIYLLNRSSQNEVGFHDVQTLLTSPFFTLFLFICLWGLLHHLISGIRFLLIDFEIGVGTECAQRSAKMVTYIAPVLALLWTVALRL